MKIKNSNLEYWCFYIDNGRIERINVLDGIAEYIKKNIKKVTNKKELKEIIRRNLMYHYWSRAEFEMGIADAFEIDNVELKDVWFQIEPNMDMITDYIINKMEIKF